LRGDARSSRGATATVGAFKQFRDEGDHLRRRRIDDVVAGDEFGSSIPKRVGVDVDRLVELGEAIRLRSRAASGG
jgi:hypothetical protein